VPLLNPVELALRERHPAGLAPVIAAGKLMMRNGEPFYIKGITYGTFGPDENGDQFPPRKRVLADFRAMAANGFNVVRCYTLPPRRIFDAALECRLQILTGVWWDQHVTFLDSKAFASDIRRRFREQVKSCHGHEGLFGFTLGNEIPASIVRWHGRKTIERFLFDLFDIAKEAAPSALTTYVNFPTTAYLELPFLDFAAYNVYLEEPEKLAAYLKRLQNIAGDMPLVLAEIGLDSRRNGQLAQAHSLDWQVRTAFREGCAGAFVYAWTDEWHCGGEYIEDWDFGLTTRARDAKPALHAVRTVMAEVPFKTSRQWPKFSVVVCSYNGSRTIRDTLDNLAKLDYPNYEVIVVNDGSTDAVPEIVKDYDVQVISTPNQGLGQARNEGLAASHGEFVVYIDDDAYPPPPWLKYLALAFLRSDHACIGGPNLVPPEDGWIGQCVADSPGGPLHVLLTDEVAEHVPGCNMAFRRARLAAIGGFDSIYRAAGDDVDVCWRLQDKGWTVGFCAPAMVWHHRRATVKRYWRQQIGYGKAEALLERKWPERFTSLGHMTWAGQIYGRGLIRPAFMEQPRIYQGTWGLAPYQSLYRPPPNHLLSLALMPEWLLLAAFVLGVAVLGLVIAPLAWAFVPFLAMAGVSIAQAMRGAMDAKYPMRARNLPFGVRVRCFALVFVLHLLQPAARLWGRLKHGLTPWRRRPERMPPSAPQLPVTIWSEVWRQPDEWLGDIERDLAKLGAISRRGGDFDTWDLYIRGGLLAGARVFMAVEGHAGAKQNLHFRSAFKPTRLLTGLAVFATVAGVSSAFAGYWAAAALFGAFLGGAAWVANEDWRRAVGAIQVAVAWLKGHAPFFLDRTQPAHATGADEAEQGPAVDAAE
jgi:glycosyltransferase involved in cell wall biosynthesis